MIRREIYECTFFQVIMAHNKALLLASPGDVSAARRAGIQFDEKVYINENGQKSGGPSLDGVLFDVRHMQQLLKEIHTEIYNAIYEKLFTKQKALQTITTFLCEKSSARVYILYYSGHGENRRGSWVFTDGTVSCDEVLNIWCQSGKAENSSLWIISDSCFSGQWIQRVQYLNISNCMFIRMLCSSEENKLSYDTPNGGDFTFNFTQERNKALSTLAVSCEFLYGQMQKNILHPFIGNYIKQNWPLSTQANSTNYGEPYDRQSRLEHRNYTPNPGQYHSNDIRQERLDQVYEQRHERLIGINADRNARMEKVQRSRNQHLQNTQQRYRHQYS